MAGYKHYIRTDANNVVIDRYSEWEGKYQAGDILTEENDERHYNFPITTERGQYKYKIIDGQMVERTQAELDVEWNARPPAPKTPEQKEMDKLKADNTNLNDQLIGLWETLLNAGVL